MRNCNIEYYKKRGGDVNEESYSSKEKVKKMFSDIVDTSLPKKTKSAQKRKLRNHPFDNDEELETQGFVVKKRKLFEDEVSAINSMM